MNRQQRRAYRRGAAAGLRRAGCTCVPTMTMVPGIDTPDGPTGAGYFVVHSSGCPLGDAMLDRNRQGITPTLFQVGGPSWRCDR